MKPIIARLNLFVSNTANFSMLLVFAVLVVSMAAGMISAINISAEKSSAISEEINRITDSGFTANGESLIEAIINQLIFPLIIFVGGMSALGPVIIPVTVAVKGYIFAFTVAAFIHIAGLQGLLSALALNGIKNLFIIPCVVTLASEGMITSFSLFNASFNSGSRMQGTAVSFKKYAARFAACTLVLTVSVILVRIATPALLSKFTGG